MFNRRELRTINIEVREPNKGNEFIKKIQSKAEDLLFEVVEHLPERMIPQVVMAWMEKYINRRMSELRQEQIKANWNVTYLEKAAEEIRNK